MRCVIPETYQGEVPEVPQYPADLLNNLSVTYGVVNLTEAAIGKNIVQLRRGGDGALEQYTSLEITDGTAVNWALQTDGNATIETWYNQKGASGDATIIQNDCFLIEGGIVNTVNGVPCPRWDTAYFQALSTYQASNSLFICGLVPSPVNTTSVYGSTNNNRRIVPLSDRVYINWAGVDGVQQITLPNDEAGFAIMGCWSDSLETIAFRNEDERSSPFSQTAGANISGGRWGSRNDTSGPYSGSMAGLILSVTDPNDIGRDTAIQSFMNIYNIT